MGELIDLLSSCKWKLKFDNKEFQEQLGSRVEYCEAEIVGGDIINLMFPLLEKYINIPLDRINPIASGYEMDPIINQIDSNPYPSCIYIYSVEFGPIRMVEYLKK